MNLLKHSFFPIGLFLFNSCSKEKSENITQLEGSYSGKFTAHYKNQGKTFSGDVTIKFKADSFFCSANKDRYPTGGSGTYQIIGNEIFFKDHNFWIADFDWAFILTHEYSNILKDDELTLTKASYLKNSYTYKLNKN